MVVVGDGLAGEEVGCRSPDEELETSGEGEPVENELGDIGGLLSRETNVR